MQEKILKQDNLNKEYSHINKVSELIANIRDQYSKQGYVLGDLKVNGLSVIEGEETRFKDNQLDFIDEIKVIYQSPEELLDESRESSLLLLREIIVANERVAELFRLGELNEAHELFKKCIEGTLTFNEMMGYFKNVYVHFKGTLLESWFDLEEQTLIVLNQLFDAYGKKNYILVGDLLEYDFITILEKWSQILEKLAKNKIERRQNQAKEV